MCSGQSERTRISISGGQIMESGVQTFENGETIFCCQQVKLAVNTPGEYINYPLVSQTHTHASSKHGGHENESFVKTIEVNFILQPQQHKQTETIKN
jgi:hypothetical protein